MKNIIYGVVMATLGVLIVIILLTINGKMTRQAEIDDSLGSSVENAIDNCFNNKNYSVENNKEFIADLQEELLTQVENDADIEIIVTGVDAERGIIGITVKEHFKNPNQSDEDQEYKTIAVLDKRENTGYYTITFLDKDDSILSQLRLRDWTDIYAPAMPSNFSYWIDTSTGQRVNNFGKVSKDATYKAVYK